MQALSPATVTMLGEVLDEVWAAPAPEFDNDAQTKEQERTRLASISSTLPKIISWVLCRSPKTATRLMRDLPQGRIDAVQRTQYQRRQTVVRDGSGRPQEQLGAR